MKNLIILFITMVSLTFSLNSHANDGEKLLGNNLKDVLNKKLKDKYFQQNSSICLRSLDHHAGIAACNKALEYKISDNDNAIHLTARGTHFLGINDLNSAKRDFNNALKYDPRHSFALNNRGMVNERQGNLHAALSDYHAASQIDGLFENNYRNMKEKIKISNSNHVVATNQEVVGKISGAWVQKTQNGAIVLKEVNGIAFERIKNKNGVSGREPIEIHHLNNSTIEIKEFGADPYVAAKCQFFIKDSLTLKCVGRSASEYSGKYIR